MSRTDKREKCPGSEKLPIVQPIDPDRFWMGVYHACPDCGRRWRMNANNDGWKDMPIPLHFRRALGD